MTAVQLSLLVPEESTGQWNPYFVAFAVAQGAPPEDLKGAYWNARFINWMMQRWAEWRVLTGVPEGYQLAHADEFGAWLAGEYPAVQS